MHLALLVSLLLWLCCTVLLYTVLALDVHFGTLHWVCIFCSTALQCYLSVILQCLERFPDLEDSLHL